VLSVLRSAGSSDPASTGLTTMDEVVRGTLGLPRLTSFVVPLPVDASGRRGLFAVRLAGVRYTHADGL